MEKLLRFRAAHHECHVLPMHFQLKTQLYLLYEYHRRGGRGTASRIEIELTTLDELRRVSGSRNKERVGSGDYRRELNDLFTAHGATLNVLTSGLVCEQAETARASPLRISYLES